MSKATVYVLARVCVCAFAREGNEIWKDGMRLINDSFLVGGRLIVSVDFSLMWNIKRLIN